MTFEGQVGGGLGGARIDARVQTENENFQDKYFQTDPVGQQDQKIQTSFAQDARDFEGQTSALKEYRSIKVDTDPKGNQDFSCQFIAVVTDQFIQTDPTESKDIDAQTEPNIFVDCEIQTCAALRETHTQTEIIMKAYNHCEPQTNQPPNHLCTQVSNPTQKTFSTQIPPPKPDAHHQTDITPLQKSDFHCQTQTPPNPPFQPQPQSSPPPSLQLSSTIFRLQIRPIPSAKTRSEVLDA